MRRFTNGFPAAPAIRCGSVASNTPKSPSACCKNARVDEEYVLKLLPELPPGDSELYSHPSLDEF